MNVLYDAGEYGFITFAILTLMLGGAAAMATGRALALTWRPVWHCIIYAAPLALAIAFLHYALFEESVIPLEIMTEDSADASSFSEAVWVILWNLRGWMVQFALFALLALIGYRLTRVRQMARQYGFAYSARGPFNWRKHG